jgi:pimeloyl-[acyl-carrier protein] methyl ester esterase
VVFFHGWGFDSHVWMPLVPQLTQHYRVILVDLPGFGLTPYMSWQEFKAQLLSQIPKHAAVVGWSLGGLYAQRLLLEEPEQISALVCVTSSPRFLADTHWPAVQNDVFAQFYRNLSLNVEKTLKEFVRLQLNTSKQSFTLGLPPSIEGLAEGLKTLEQWDFRQQLHDVTKPVCFMFGRRDPIVPVKVMHLMQREYPQCSYVFFNRAAHMPFLSHQMEFITELKRFIL